jgi:aminopeptidase-like protein
MSMPSHLLRTLLADEAAVERAQSIGEDMLQLVRELFPLPRSITGAGLRATVARLGQLVPLEVTELASGTPIFDWMVPNEWTIDEAFIEHESGQRFASLAESNLHVVNYSTPIDRMMCLEELRPHLHSLPEHPGWIPYKTSYYTPSWGFCLPHRVLEKLPQGTYRALIRSEIKPGAMTLAEFRHAGATQDEILVFAHDCHPSLANDNLSGLAVAVHLAQHVARRRTHYSYRFVFAPATIGSIAWLALNQDHLARIRHGIVLSLVGNDGPLHFKRSRRGDSAIDRAASHVLDTECRNSQVVRFSPWGFDERQFCSPGINLPIGALSRSPDALLEENHTSADTPDSLSSSALSEAWLTCLKIFDVLENDRRYVNLSPNGEPQLGRRGLYRTAGGYYTDVPERQMALLWVLNQSDGNASILDIAERSSIPARTLIQAAAELESAGLLRAEEAQ